MASRGGILAHERHPPAEDAKSMDVRLKPWPKSLLASVGLF